MQTTSPLRHETEDTTAAARRPAHVSIVGAGSLGLVLAATLARAGNLVTLLARPGSASALTDNGHIEVSGQLAFAVSVSPPPAQPGQVAVTALASSLPEAHALFFTPKGQDLRRSIDELAGTWPSRRLDGGFVAGLQNGVVKDELLSEAFGPADVVGAATVLGSQRNAPGSVNVAGLGTTFLGEFVSPTSARTEMMAATLAQAGLPCVVVPDIANLLWTKFCNAAGIFGVSATTGVPSREIFSRRPLALAYHSLIVEAAAVARSEGAQVGNFVDLPIRSYLDATPEEAAAEMGRRAGPLAAGPPGAAPPSYSSMAQDLAAGRGTEVEETFGDLVRRAHAHGLDLPRCELIYRVVAGAQKGTGR